MDGSPDCQNNPLTLFQGDVDMVQGGRPIGGGNQEDRGRPAGICGWRYVPEVPTGLRLGPNQALFEERRLIWGYPSRRRGVFGVSRGERGEGAFRKPP